MYQNLRHLIDPASVEEKDTNSIHYLMLPQVRLEKSIQEIFSVEGVDGHKFIICTFNKRSLPSAENLLRFESVPTAFISTAAGFL